MRLIISILLFYFNYANSSFNEYNSMQIKNLKIWKCEPTDYPLTVNNVRIQLSTKPKVKVSGSMSSRVNLTGPIKAAVSLERDIWGVWIPMPCEENMGSCTYENLCDFGYPENSPCPPEFLQNNVPCRCPIKEGNYTIQPSASINLEKTGSISSGTYKGSVVITQKKDFLSCYNIYFTLYSENDVYSVIQL